MKKAFLLILILLPASFSLEDKYSRALQLINSTVFSKEFEGKAYKEFSYLFDSFSSSALDSAFEHLLNQTVLDGFETVGKENVSNASVWEKRTERLILSSPRKFPFSVKVRSISGSKGNATGEVILLNSADEFERQKSQLKEKIVFFNKFAAFNSFPNEVEKALKFGAVGIIYRDSALHCKS